MKPLFTKRGMVTRDGLACGYVQISKDGKTRLEKVAYGPGILVRSDNGHKTEYCGPSLHDARAAFNKAAR